MRKGHNHSYRMILIVEKISQRYSLAPRTYQKKNYLPLRLRLKLSSDVLTLLALTSANVLPLQTYFQTRYSIEC